MSVALNWALLSWGMGLTRNRRCYSKQWKPCWASADAHEGRAPATLPLLGHLYGCTQRVHAQQLCWEEKLWLMVAPVWCELPDRSSFRCCLGTELPHAWFIWDGGRREPWTKRPQVMAGEGCWVKCHQQMLLWICNTVPQRGRRSTSFSLSHFLTFSPAATACCQYGHNVSTAVPETSV